MRNRLKDINYIKNYIPQLHPKQLIENKFKLIVLLSMIEFQILKAHLILY